MKPSEVKQKLTDSYHARTPMFVWGAPGVGKSDVVRWVRDTLDIGMVDERLSQMDPVDLRGLPFNDNGYTSYAIPGWLPRVDRDGENGILFLDELNTATQSIQAAAYQLILDRKLGDYVLPEGWVCFAAGNRAEDRAIAIRMSTALGTRFGHIDFDVDLDEWKVWARNNKIDHDIISFMNWKGINALHNMDVKQRTFPCPRTWESLNKHIPYVSPVNEFDTYACFVGEGAAGEFSAFKKMARDLPSYDEIMAEPKHIKVPEETSTLYAVSGMLASRTSEDTFPTMMKYIKRIPMEYQTVYMTDALAVCEDIEDLKEFTEWALENHYVIL